jgi:hypothetical protein
MVPRAIAIKVGDHAEGTVCFDTDLLRCAAGWTGGFVTLHPERYGLINPPSLSGTIQFTSRPQPGWARDGNFTDPRPAHAGALPKEWAHYSGFYVSGNQVVLNYRVGDLNVLDSPWLEMIDGHPVFTRTLQIQGKGTGLVHLCDERGASVKEVEAGKLVRLQTKAGALLVSISDTPGSSLAVDGSGLNLRIASEGACRVKVCIGKDLAAFPSSLKEGESLDRFVKGGAAHWTNSIETHGVLGKPDGAFAIDTITLPYVNPWNALLFASGHDFFANGDAALATVHGDVWRVSGIDANLTAIRWKRFATGLYEPLGLKVVQDKVYVIERDQITVLHDLNNDGEADYYENFNNDCISTGARHAFATCLETDSAGNFYFLKCAEQTPQGGSVLKVSADGSRLDVIASGFRNPNGMAISPSDVITVADQQGEWVPETRLDIIKSGRFYGYMPMHKTAAAPTSFEPPLCWIPRALDNSAGGQGWIPAGEWGPLGGHMLHLSYGRCTMMLILQDDKDPSNGAAVPLPGRFLSGAMRARFNSKDKSLYVSGLRGWQTAAVKDGCFQRVRYTGAPLLAPCDFALESDGVRLTFDQPLDGELARDISSYSVEEWNYKWSAQYGSADYSLRKPGKKGRDAVQVKSAKLVAPNSIQLAFGEPLGKVNVLRTSYSLESTAGVEMRGDFFCTVNQSKKKTDSSNEN